MSKVLIHYDASGDPVGLHRTKGDEELESYYLPTVDKQWKQRGADILEKGEASYEDLFERLQSSSPYLDRFGMTEAEEDEPMDAIMYRVSRESVRE